MGVGLLWMMFLALVLVAPTTGQQAEDATESSGPFFEAIDVEVVNIDVWVTDASGQPVTGLGKGDFVVLRDGRPVEISNFYAVADGRPSETTSGIASDAAEQDAARGDRPPELPTIPQIAPEHQLWLILFIDNYNIEPIERNRILPDLYRFLGRVVEARGKALVVTYDRALEVRQPFTDELFRLTDVLAEIKDDSGFATLRRREQMETLARIDKSDSASQALRYARNYAEEQMNSVGYTVEALERFVETLAGLPGRKALVHVSSGIPMLAGEEMFHAVAEKFDTSEAYGEIPRHDTTRGFEKVGRIANAHRVAFHTVDAGGLRGIEFGAAEYAGFVNPRLRQTLDSVVPENLQSSLRFVAGETGGRSILNRNEILPALEEVERDFGSFYSLGITSADGESGRYHSIDVKLRERPRGVRLRHRAGYRSKSQEVRVQEALRSALLYAHQSNSLEIGVDFGQPELDRSEASYLLPIELDIPLRELALLPTVEGKQELRLRLFVAAAGKDGSLSAVDAVPLGLRLAEEHVEAARRESLRHAHRLLLARGRQKVGVAVLDVFGGEYSVVTGIVQAGPVEDDAPTDL